MKDFLHVTEQLEYRLGSVLADEYDFGSAKQINGLFGDLVNRTPFSADEAIVYSRLVNDRNLIVHHGGAYTLKYAYQNFPPHEIPSKVFDYGITVGISDVLKAAEFLRGIAKKLTVASRDALVEFAEAGGLSMADAQQGAISMMDEDDWKFDQRDGSGKSS